MKKDNRLTDRQRPMMPPDDQVSERRKLMDSGALLQFESEATPFGDAIFSTATSVWEFFHLNGYMVCRQEWDKKTIVPLLCSYEGWVYAFYGKEESAVRVGTQDAPLYVGETGQTFRERFAQHKRNTPRWWPHWTRVKVLPCPNQSMRKVFESLIGLAGGYVENKLQPPLADGEMLDDVILSLLLLKNDTNEQPAFPKSSNC